mgnify:CR=1 FL=1
MLSITIHPRGKYAGVKVHLDGEEAGRFLEWAGVSCALEMLPAENAQVIKFASKLGNKIECLIEEIPNLLKDRTEEQIKGALYKDQDKIKEQLQAIEKGKDWKKVL